MLSFIIKYDSANVNVYKVESDLFGNNFTLMGWFPLYNKHKAEDFLVFLRSNPTSNITDFFKSYTK